MRYRVNMKQATATVLLFASANAAPLLSKRSEATTNLPYDFPDPSLTLAGDTWYSFATNSASNTVVHIPIASSPDFNSWTIVGGQYNGWADALPNLPAWVDAGAPNTWAPDVSQLDDGSFIMYFAGTYNADMHNPKGHCVSAATSGSIEGPYHPLGQTLACPTDQGGAIDPAGFRDSDGTRYMLYKIDGNSLGMQTSIVLQPMQADGITLNGVSTTLLTSSGIVEAPSLLHAPDGTYILFYSSNLYSTPDYTVSWASSSSVTGPFTEQGTLFGTGTDGLSGPGGATAWSDGSHMVFHANEGSSFDGTRLLHTALIQVNGNTVTA